MVVRECDRTVNYFFPGGGVVACGKLGILLRDEYRLECS